jgi:hypothetical protein
MTVYAFSSFSFGYLNRARVLAKTLKALHPDWAFWAVIVDTPPEGLDFDPESEGFSGVLTAADLFGGQTDAVLFGHDIVEACTAAKGIAATHLLEKTDCEKLFFFDPDIALFNSMDEVVVLLDRFSIVLTPHQTDPEPRENKQAILDNEIASLSYGVFNLGFVALANDAEGRRFAAWWAERLADWCWDRLDIGIFVDQKWCNLVPCFFDGVKILRDPGYNVASWNLSQRKMHFDAAGQAQINGRPLRFYHFTKLGPLGDQMTQRYAGENIEIFELWRWYREQVAAGTDTAIPKGWWAYGQFDTGQPVPKSVRELYRNRVDLRTAFKSPFATGDGSLLQWLEANTNLLDKEEKRGFLPV